MNAKAIRPSAAVAWASLFFSILPLAYLAALYFAFRREALAQGELDRWTTYFRVLGAPGLLLCRVVGYEPSFWVEHATGPAYWRMLAAFLIANFVGWLAVTTSAALIGRWLKVRFSREHQPI